MNTEQTSGSIFTYMCLMRRNVNLFAKADKHS